MKRSRGGWLGWLSCFSFFVVSLLSLVGEVSAQDAIFKELTPVMSVDGLSVTDGFKPLVVVADPDPNAQGIKVEGFSAAQALAEPNAAAATFSITYVAAGGTDKWGQVCTTFPTAAKTAFNAAAAIWSNQFQSPVPITIKACWASLSSPSTLGYSGGGTSHRDFSGAPRAATWFSAALANSRAGSDLDPANHDMHITYNSNFSWYYGTDESPPFNQHDLVTVAAHEIGHGLNFHGSASYSNGVGSWGNTSGYPNIYDTFMRDVNGVALLSSTYPNNSAALGTLLTSNNLWFRGTNAMAANGGQPVKMYAPASWSGGSSYSHLNYDTFRNTSNSMMVYAIGAGSANHNPGAVTIGLLKDLGWVATVAAPCAVPASITVPVADADGAYTVSWGASTTPGVSYVLQEATNSLFTTGLRTAYTGTARTVNIAGRSQNVTYYYRVRATKTGLTASGWRAGANGCAVPGSAAAGVPASITVPLSDADGAYTVSWGASATAGVTYELQEATNSLFTTGLRAAYRGVALSTAITGRSQNVTYYYRVRAVKAGLKDSAYRTKTIGCAVPGTAMVGVPVSVTVPATDNDGAYTVSWGASATAGVTYELQEATNNTFTAGVRSAYRGTARTANITARLSATTYYYRVRAVKGGLKDSAYRNAGNGCAVTLQPGTISGLVVSATTGLPLSGATVTLSPGGAVRTTGSAGTYSFTGVSPGTYTATAARTSYVSVSNSVVVTSGATVTKNFSLSPTGNSAVNYRVVLNWGALPYDLDSHLYVPNPAGGYGHVYFGNKGSQATFPYTQLDIDDTDSYGPETITLYQKQAGTYQYWVDNWSETPDITTSSAQVRLYSGSTLLRTFNVPVSPAGQYTWHVFDLNAQTGVITTVNTLHSTLPALSVTAAVGEALSIKTKK